MILVEGGTFTMGDVFNEGRNDELLIHQVTLNSFYIGKYEVTQKEYQALMGTNPSYFKGDNLPVEQVSWFDAIKYCNALSTKEGLPKAYNEITGDLLDETGNVTTDITKVKGYRLPTEAEWEYAAREGGKKVRFGNGKDIADTNEINFNATVGSYSYLVSGETYRGKTTDVGTFAPNSLGLYDMSGNVWEWCTDWWSDYTSSAQTNPNINNGSRRVLRGGSWGNYADYVRASYRYYGIPANGYNFIGFRLTKSKI